MVLLSFQLAFTSGTGFIQLFYLFNTDPQVSRTAEEVPRAKAGQILSNLIFCTIPFAAGPPSYLPEGHEGRLIHCRRLPG